MVVFTSGPRTKKIFSRLLFIAGFISVLTFIGSCTTGRAEPVADVPPVPVMTIDTAAAVTYRQYATSLRGVADIEVRPQAEGYLEKIYIDEGQYVKAGQPLFLIHSAPYEASLSNASAALQTAKAQEENARIEVARLEKLVAGKVISPVKLQDARAVLEAASSAVAQAEAVRRSAAINKGFTTVNAAVSGYAGIIPYKTGSLVGRNETLPLTVLSDIHKVHAYFSMSEKDFLWFKRAYAGNTLNEKISAMPPVTLLLADNTEYGEKGKVEIVNGQFDRHTAAITFRATFPNPGGLLRSGNTGTIVLPQRLAGAIRIPQSATFEVQNKVMAYVIGKDGKIANAPLVIADRDTDSYIISDGLKPGDRIVVKGLDRLQEGMEVKPESN